MVWPAVIGGFSAAQSLLGSTSRRRQQRKEKAIREQQFGKNAAAIDFSLARRQSLVPDQTRVLNENSQLAKLELSKSQAQSEADQRVQAAAAGVSGSSVDVSIADTERTKAENEYLINIQTARGLEQAQISIVDDAISAQISKGSLVNNTRESKGLDVANAGLSFLSSFALSLNNN